MVKIISYNLNGIRSAVGKGLVNWLKTRDADVVCFQETKAHEEDIPKTDLESLGYHSFWFSAQKKGYSSVGVLSKKKPLTVTKGNGYKMSDEEGRVITLEFEEFILVNAYFPSGTTGDVRQDYKYQWLDEFSSFISKLQKENKKPFVITGDYNIAHHPIDIHNPINNANSSGFLPEERAWLTRFFAEQKLVDGFRYIHPEKKDAYSWWSFRANARANNKGWRIDYIAISENIKDKIDKAEIYPADIHSDHCAVEIVLSI